MSHYHIIIEDDLSDDPRAEVIAADLAAAAAWMAEYAPAIPAYSWGEPICDGAVTERVYLARRSCRYPISDCREAAYQLTWQLRHAK